MQASPPNFDALSESLYEVIDGRIVEQPPMGTAQELTTGVLHTKLAAYADQRACGLAVMEVLFDWTEQLGRKRRPDAAFIANERLADALPATDDDGWKVVPNLAVEVISRTNTWEELHVKIHEYFRVGVERVWVISTAQRSIHAYDSTTSVHILTLQDNLTDPTLLPGFDLPLRDLFALVNVA